MITRQTTEITKFTVSVPTETIGKISFGTANLLRYCSARISDGLPWVRLPEMKPQGIIPERM